MLHLLDVVNCSLKPVMIFKDDVEVLIT